jgi:hypothetical protein
MSSLWSSLCDDSKVLVNDYNPMASDVILVAGRNKLAILAVGFCESVMGRGVNETVDGSDADCC